MNAALKHLGVVSRAYETAANEYISICQDLAEAERAFVHAKAVYKVKARHEAGEKITDVELQDRAHAEAGIDELYGEFLRLKNAEKSLYQKLRQLKTQNDNGRTAAVEEREVDKLHALGQTGAA